MLILFPAYMKDKLYFDMDNKTMESYLDNIAEQVVDEDKIITYKSLSRSLGIHVNTAKQLLYTYLTNEKSRNSFPISATYFVAGKVIDGSFNVVIVNEADLKLAHSKFVEVTSEHVYSVQKGKSLKDLKLLCAVDKESPNSKSSNLVIKCSKSVLKSKEEGKKKAEPNEESNKKVIKQVPVPENQGTRQEKQASAPEKVETPITNENASKCPKKTSPKVKENSGKTVKKPAGNIASMFAKVAQKNASKPVKPVKSGTNEVGKDVEVVNVKEGREVEQKTEGRNLGKIGETKEGLKKKKKGSKRKRIQIFSDSEESNSENEEAANVQDEEPPSPPPVKPAEEEVKDTTARNKRKKRKVIDKTIMNEDGYLETRKEVVFETDSENEVEEVPAAPREHKKPKVESTIDKGKGQGGGTVKKQSSLLTFFKKN